jgi:peptidoglycan hydrolase-like protein with peptidoglycan-binding domain
MNGTGESEDRRISPARLVAAIGTGLMCLAVAYNALTGQEGRRRESAVRLPTLEIRTGAIGQQTDLPAPKTRPTTRTRVDVSQAIDPPDEPPSEVDASLTRRVQKVLAALNLYEGPADGKLSQDLRSAIETYEMIHGFDLTGKPSEALLDNLQLELEIARASESRSTAAQPAAMDIGSVQKALQALGYATGPADGNLGPKTQEAIRQFERDRSLPETGSITPALLLEIGKTAASMR